MSKKLTNNVGRPRRRQPEFDDRRAPRPHAAPGRLVPCGKNSPTSDREVIPERRMHAKGSGAFGAFTVTHDITKYSKAKIFSEIGKKTELVARFSTVAGERGAADAERDIRGFAVKFYTEEGNWDMVGNNTPVFFLKDPAEVSRPSITRSSATPQNQHAKRSQTTGTSGPACPKPCTRSRSP